AVDRLGDAVVRLYERYAELLPDGAARARAAATACSVTGLPVRARVEPADVDRYAAVLAPALEFVDHRTLGAGSTQGANAYLAWVHALYDLSDNVGIRIYDVLGLRSDALLVHLMNTGTQRSGGGDYERPFLILWAFGPDGLVARIEQFDAERDGEALARFDE